MTEPLEPFDPGNFRLSHRPTNPPRKAQAPYRRRLSPDTPFLAGPVDMEWLSQRQQCGRDIDFSDYLFEEWREAYFEDQPATTGEIAEKE